MGLSEQFVGIDMKNLIGSPLGAAAQASIFLAHSTAEFINQVGFDTDGTARQVSFQYHQAVPDTDGHLHRQEMRVELPLLSVVPIPNLQIDEVRVLFDMEVKHYEKNEAGRHTEAGASGGAGFGPAKVAITGNISSHSANTRSSDNSAKYEMRITASNHGVPEGLARVLDVMASQVAAVPLSSRPVDESGNELDESRRALYQRLRDMRAQGLRLEQAVQIGRQLFEGRMNTLEKRGRGVYAASRFEAQRRQIPLQEIEECWDRFQHHLMETVCIAASPVMPDQVAYSLSDYLPLQWLASFTDEKQVAVVKQLHELFDQAVQAYRQYIDIQAELEENHQRCGGLLLQENRISNKSED